MPGNEEIPGISIFLNEVLPACFDVHYPVESLDFACWLDAEEQRDGCSRPVLVGDTPPAPPARAKPRAQTVNVTNVYQTVVQAGPATALAVARPAAAHEGSSSLACLEQSLRVKSGSIARPASRWRHAPKGAAVHAATPQAVGMLQCGTMLVPALSADAHVGGRPHNGELEAGQVGCLSGLRPPLRSHEAPGCVGMPSDAATACTTIAVAAQAGDITIPIDLFDWEAPVASPPHHPSPACTRA